MNTKNDKDENNTLALLEAIDNESSVSQRQLASHLGVALGLANSYLKRCVRKGWIKVKDAPANRYLYYLTPKGFAEKSRLTAKYLSSSLEFYRKARQSCQDIYQQCHDHQWQRLLLCGLSELTEIAILQAIDSDITIVGIYHPDCKQRQLLGKNIWNGYADSAEHDACLLTDLQEPLQSYQHLIEIRGNERLLVPDILAIEPNGASTDLI